MPTTIAAVIAKAASQIGKYFPGNSPYGEWYAQQYGSVYKNAQFCAMGLSWCFDQVGALDIFPKHAYTPSGVQWFKNKGWWHTGSINNIPRGAILYFNFPGAPNRVSHVGIAEFDGANGRVQTIEFNTSGTANGDQRNGRVVARKIRTSSIVGWGFPAYSGANVPTLSKPAWDNRGYTMQWIKDRQGQLNKVGNYKLVVDGKLGSASMAATRDFQSKNGLTVDGVPGPDTKAKLDAKLAGGSPTPPKPATKPDCTPLQKAVRTAVDNKWGANTDKNADAIRYASQWGGVRFPWGISFTQAVVGTARDSKWGANSRTAHDRAVIAVQKALKAMGFDPGDIDGKWGAKTEAAYQAARRACHI